MANFKRKRRRAAGVRGCCGMCMMQRFYCIHHRIPTRQEERAKVAHKEQLKELKR